MNELDGSRRSLRDPRPEVFDEFRKDELAALTRALLL
jgi:hypothetical protein